jgi:uncharacterized OB-fold protein
MGPEAQYFENLKQGRFMLQRRNTGQYVFYPRWLPGDWEWTEVSGKGEVYSRTVVRQPAERGGDYCIALVTLAEGPRMMTRVIGIAPSDVTIGMKVRAEIAVPDWNPDAGPNVVFLPAAVGER